MATASITLELPEPLPQQIPVLQSDARFKLLSCGRRWGKSVLSAICMLLGHGSAGQLKGALHGGNIWYVAPTYPMAQDMWRLIKRIAEPLATFKSEQLMRVDLMTGGSVSIKSSDNPDGLRGVGLDGVVVDEAAFHEEEVWFRVLRPALADKQGWGIIISTPNGLNWFHRLYLEAEFSEGWQRWQQPTSSNPLIAEDELRQQRAQVDSHTWAQEFLAAFVSPSGSRIQKEWFRYYRKVGGFYVFLRPGGDVERRAHESEFRRIIMVDPAGSGRDVRREKQGKGPSYTVIGTFDIHKKTGQLVWVNVCRGRWEIPEVCDKVEEQYQQWQPESVGIENQGLGLAVMQTLKYRPLPIRALRPKGKDKVERATKAIVMLEAGKIYHPEPSPEHSWLRDLENELLLWTGHDDDTADQVDVLAYAAMDAVNASNGSKPIGMSIASEVPKGVQFKRPHKRF